MTELSDTPETDNLARGNHVVPTEWAEQLERERDEARAQAKKLEGAYEDATNYYARWSQLIEERDEARLERDSLQALSQSLAETCTKLKTERDEARGDFDNMQDQRDLAMKVIKRLEQERDEWAKLCGQYKQERDEARVKP